MGWRSRRREVRLAARRAYARMRTTPSLLSRTAEVAAITIAGLAYAVSYASLYDLALRHNFGGPANWESVVWPLTVDLASLATGIIALDRAHRGKSAWLAGVISAVAAALMVAGNILANANEPPEWRVWVTVGMHAWPPGIALACWYMLVRARRDDANDRGLLESGEGKTGEPANEDPPGDSQPPSPKGTSAKRIDPKVLRIARDGGDWKRVAAATQMGEHAAKRALTAARKQLASPAQDIGMEAPGGTGQGEVAA